MRLGEHMNPSTCTSELRLVTVDFPQFDLYELWLLAINFRRSRDSVGAKTRREMLLGNFQRRSQSSIIRRRFAALQRKVEELSEVDATKLSNIFLSII